MITKEKIESYISEIRSCNSEASKFQTFTLFLKDLFKLSVQLLKDYVRNIDRTLTTHKEGTGIIRRRPDSLFGNVVLEFERDLNNRTLLKEAQRQLKDYLYLLKEIEPDTVYTGIATDGIIFKVYTLIDNLLSEIETFDITKASPEEAFFFLDRYFLREHKRPLTTELILKDFGVNSLTFLKLSSKLKTLFQKNKGTPHLKTLFEEWKRYISLAYGEDLATEELFIRHTYLSLILKSLILKIFERLDRWERVIKGETFKEEGIENLFEEDFFCWIARKEILKELEDELNKILNVIDTYKLKGLKEDVLKELYQELVDPQTRHDLGEFYTPDWLAELMVKEVLKENPELSVLDPSCGSGTFLYFTILEKLKRNLDVNHVLNTVAGIDIHPLAVLTAKTNYLLALKEHLKDYIGKVFIPVYLADSLRIPKVEGTLIKDAYVLDILDKKVRIPAKLTESQKLFDEVLTEIGKLLSINISKKGFSNYFKRYPGFSEKLTAELYENLYKPLKRLKEEDKDTIWIFILRNIFRPIFMKGKFDIVIGNPPWIVLRTIKNREYYNHVKKLIKEDFGLEKRAKNITHLEMAVLFALESAENFLKEKGKVFFVVTRSIFNASHHKTFRAGNFKKIKLGIKEVWDLENVSPLFTYPALSILMEKGGKTTYPVKAKYFSGRLNRKNESLEKAKEELKIEEKLIYLSRTENENFWSYGKSLEFRKSYYFDRFFQGATIVPRNLFFVEVVRDLGKTVRVKQSESISYKKPYVHTFKEIFDEEIPEIERKFLFETVLGGDVVPFGILRKREVILPILSENGKTILLKKEDALDRGYIYLYQWLDKVERYWKKFSKGRLNIYQQINYQNKLLRQDFEKRYKVIYPTSSRQMCCACVKGIIADAKTYVFGTSDSREGFYLSAVLNSQVVQELLETSFDIRRKRETPDIHKKPLQLLPFPEFNPENENHLRLAEISRELHQKVGEILKDPELITKPVGNIRKVVKEQIKEELKEIDRLVALIVTQNHENQ